MRKLHFSSSVLIFIVIYFGCGNTALSQDNNKAGQLLKKRLIESWGGIYNSNDYNELHFVNDSIYISIQDSAYYHVPDSYQWNGEDTICLAPFSLCYKACINGDTLKLMIKDKSFIFERIKPSPDLITDFFLDGFVIRKYIFLLSKGIISSNEAYKQLYKYIEDYNILDTTYYDVEDENIFPVKK